MFGKTYGNFFEVFVISFDVSSLILHSAPLPARMILVLNRYLQVRRMFRRSMRKTFLMLSALVIVLVFIALSVFMAIVHNILQENAYGYLRVTHKQIQENIESYLQDIESAALTMCYSPSVQRYLLEEDPVERLRLFSEVQSVFSNLYYMDYAISCFSLYDAEGKLLAVNGSSHMGITMQDHLDAVPNPVYATEYPANSYIGKTYDAYTLTMPVLEQAHETPTGRRIGTFVFTVEAAYIGEQVQAANANQGTAVTIRDAGGKLLASSQSQLPPSMKVFQETSFETVDWTLTTYYQSGVLNGDMTTIFQLTLVTALLIACLLLGFAWLVSRKLIKPISGVSCFMQEVTRAPEARQYHPAPRQYAELQAMTDSMNLMLRALDQKTAALLAQEKRAHEAELANDQLEILAYRSQINPHFLYNTLECISGMAMMYNAGEIAEISQSLSNMFRYAIKGNDMVSVAEEVTHMKEYATIIGYRFMGRISIQFHIAPEALPVMIPRLVLQPIVENGVFHGLEPKPGQGNIHVHVYLDGPTLVMRVQDDGLGIEAPQLQAIQRRLDDTEALLSGDAQDKKGIGLWNIARRLDLFYQGRATFTFESVLKQGTTVEIRLPLQAKEETVCTD